MEAWQALLQEVIDKLGQAETARRLGLSASTVSQVSNGKYPADPGNIADKIITVFGDEKMQQEQIPKGYKKNAVGHLVPIEAIKDEDLARDDFVRETMSRAYEIGALVAGFKTNLAGEMQAWLDMAAEKYGAKIGGMRGNLTLTSFDGKCQILRAVSDLLDFDEALMAAKALIDECLREWTRGGDPRVRALIDDAFQVDKKGRINAKRILALRRLNIDDEKWLRAMAAISDSLKVVGSRTYYRFYERDENGNYQQIPLDFSAV